MKFQSAILLLSAWTTAASWHVSPQGDDSRTSTQAQDPATPWKTLAKAAAAALQPGDSLILARDGIWHEQLVLSKSGTASSPIVVAPYGSGSKPPQLRGTVALVGVPGGSGSSANVPGTTRVRRLFDGDLVIPPTRFPDTGWLVAGTVHDSTSLSCQALNGKDWTGASIHLRTSRWTLETHRIARIQGARIWLDAHAIYGPPDSVRFFLTNASAANLNRDVWFQDSTTGKVLWTYPHQNVEASVLGPLVELGGSSHVVVHGLSLFGAAGEAVHSSGSDALVEGCEILYPSLVGVYSSGNHLLARGNTIRGAGNGAAVLNGSGHRVEGNRIRATSLAPELGPEGMGDGCCGGRAVDVSGDSATISDNDIDSTGYIGIGFRAPYSAILRNLVGHSCMTTDDCAGIYTWGGKYADAGSMGTIIRHNFVHDAVGAQSGWPEIWEGAQGIYIDDGSHDIVVDSNTSWGNGYGIQLHNNQHTLSRGNVLFGNRKGPLTVSHDNLAGAGDMVDNRVEGNLFVAMPGQSSSPNQAIYQAQTAPMATFAGNTSCWDQILSAGCSLDGVGLWSRDRIAESDPRLGPQTQRNFGFDSAKIGWTSWPEQVTLARESGAVCGQGNCLKASYLGDTASRSPLINTGRNMPVAAGQAYRLSFRAKGLNPGQTLNLAFRRGWGDWASVGLSAPVALDTAWTAHAFLFRISTTDSAARLDIHNSKTDSVYWIDDISLRTVPDSLATAQPGARLASNPSGTSTEFDLGSGAWMSPEGLLVPQALALAPWSSRVAFAVATNAAIQRTTHARSPSARFRHGLWEFHDLTTEAQVVDLRGRIVARIQPDIQGRATWRPTAAAYACWLRSSGGTVALMGVE